MDAALKTASNFTKKEKDAKILEEVKRLQRLSAVMGEDGASAVDGLIQEAAFMRATLEDLKISINRDGCIGMYQNSATQWGTRKSPEVETYNTMIKNYIMVVKQIAEVLPKGSPEAEKEIMEFLKSGD